ncbi:hypothetical protein L3X38_011186 [Prunus dulcis]|uniref:DUF4283 domain-containing protein n=1 Tax=Prunus dulcis TaxID=3755 RepID=A0AAD4WGX3_PRUDU|nr:hypothetical protein L3X38_011186 [Prunus dulcis]
MAAWIRVSAIQLECFDVWVLKRNKNLLGKLLKIDALTTSQNQGKFARLCVELDLSRPFEAFVQINNVWYNVEYEGLPDIAICVVDMVIRGSTVMCQMLPLWKRLVMDPLWVMMVW